MLRVGPAKWKFVSGMSNDDVSRPSTPSGSPKKRMKCLASFLPSRYKTTLTSNYVEANGRTLGHLCPLRRRSSVTQTDLVWRRALGQDFISLTLLHRGTRLCTRWDGTLPSHKRSCMPFWMPRWSQTLVTIYADCYSAIQALISHGLQGRQVYECVEALNDLGRDRALTLTWIPVHAGYSGNEHVEGLAKEGADTPFFVPEPVILVSPKLVPGIIDTQVRERHRIRWTTWPECRQSKQVMVAPNRGNRRLCLGLSRALLRILTPLVHGHCLLAHHLFKIGVETDPAGPLWKREHETPDHFVCECEAFCEARSAILGKPFLQPEELASVSLPSLLKYSLRTKRFKWNKQLDNSTP
jgi:hypothetical protein